ncbi:hypothetical protein TgHK011_008057 [Trichoderma gracile]|nr:hypothetical protein TgHK011_008057 [Trichoderma gracile]
MHVSGPNAPHRVRQQCGAGLENSGRVSNKTKNQGRGSENYPVPCPRRALLFRCSREDARGTDHFQTKAEALDRDRTLPRICSSD